MHDFLTSRGVRDRSEISLVTPLPVPIPPSPDASKVLLAAFEARGIAWRPQTLVRGLDPQRKVALLGDDGNSPTTCSSACRPTACRRLSRSRAWPSTGGSRSLTLETQFPDVYAVGDVTSVGTPKAGVFAEGQAVAAARGIGARIRSADSAAPYDGRGFRRAKNYRRWVTLGGM